MLTQYRKILKSKLTFLVLIPIVLALLFSIGQRIYYQYQARVEFNELAGQVEILKKQKDDLDNLVGYYNDKNNLEKEARIRLNVKKPGENVVIVLPQATSTGESSKLSSVSESKTLPNWKQWWYYFWQGGTK